MRETGKVVKLLENGLVEVEMGSNAGCVRCGLCKIGLNNKAYMTAKAYEPVAVGDNVEVEAQAREVIFITFLIFILPLLIFFGGYVFFNYIFAIIFVVIYYVLLWWYDRDSQKSGKYLPQVIRKL